MTRCRILQKAFRMRYLNGTDATGQQWVPFVLQVYVVQITSGPALAPAPSLGELFCNRSMVASMSAWVGRIVHIHVAKGSLMTYAVQGRCWRPCLRLERTPPQGHQAAELSPALPASWTPSMLPSTSSCR